MAVSGSVNGETPESLATPAFVGFTSSVKSGRKTALTTDRKIFQSHKFRAIIVQNQISGCSSVDRTRGLGPRGSCVRVALLGP